MSLDLPAMRESRVIFSRDEENFTARDVIDAALVRGDLARPWEDFVRALECERRATEEEIELDESAIDSAAVAFRYQHDLITAEETERWLDDRGVTMEEFGEYFARQFWARNYAGEIAASEREYVSAALEEKDLLVVHLTLSGELDRLAEQLSFRVAAQAAQPAMRDIVDEREKFMAREKISDLPEWLEKIGRNEDWLNFMLGADLAYRWCLDSLFNDKMLQSELIATRLNLTRFELETIEVDSRDAAAEVMACVRSDGMELHEIAEESRYPLRRIEVLLEDLPAEQQGSFLSVKAGAMLEPISRDDGWEVWRVKSRLEPQLSEPSIRERLQERISRRHFAELVGKYIDWKLLQPAAE